MKSLPATLPYFAASPRPAWPAVKEQQDDIVSWLKQGLEGGVKQTLTIAGGVVTPAESACRYIELETEGSAASDDLDRVAVTNVPEGSWIALRCVDAARATTVKNASGGSGQFALLDATDVKLDDPDKLLVCRNEGGTWKEMWRVKVSYLMWVLDQPTARTLSYHDIGKVITNAGATALAVYTLPAAAAGWGPFILYVDDADGIELRAVGDDTIRVAGVGVSSAAGSATSTTIGSFLVVVAISSTKWVTIGVGGTWAVA